MYGEDGGNPSLLSWCSELSGLTSYLRRLLKCLKIIGQYGLGLHNDANLSAEIARLLGPGCHSMGLLLVLPMGCDLPNGNLFLWDGFGEDTMPCG